MRIRELVYHFPKVVIGNDLAGLFQAYHEDCTFLLYGEQPYKFFDYAPLDWELEKWFNFEPQINVFKTLTDDLELGMQKIALWDHIYFKKSIAGEAPLPKNCENLRIDPVEKLITVTTRAARLIKFTYDECIIVNLNIDGMWPGMFQELKQKQVIDIFSVDFNIIHPFDYINTKKRNLGEEIFFYTTHFKFDTEAVRKTKAVVKSTIDNKHLESEEFSPIASRYNMQDFLKRKEFAIITPGDGRTRHPSLKFLYRTIREINLNDKKTVNLETKNQGLRVIQRTDQEAYRYNFRDECAKTQISFDRYSACRGPTPRV